uniref:Transmembrane protein 218 n=1 Tax=Palpitomonas bilix TaxID=652834 RepID=A0A7S3CXT2_9EUKA|mmetsp:Transcript_13983/g.35998  ORF Transcript_13983/g.35998 Transcript_13983/m.35998 type:complete len:130 (+) Transcript_13983:138-527(+)
MLPTLLQTTTPSNLVLGLGPGLFIIILLSVLGIVTCVIGSRTDKSGLIILATTLVLAIIFLSLLLTPRSDTSNISATKAYDYSIIYRIFFIVCMILGLVAGLIGVLTSHLSVPVFNQPLPDISAWKRQR